MLGRGPFAGDVRRGAPKNHEVFSGGGGLSVGNVGPRWDDSSMSEGLVVAVRAVMDSMAAWRALEFSGDAQSRIDGLKARRMVRRQCDLDSLELIAGLDQDGEFADRGVRAADAVCDLLGLGRREARRMVAVAVRVFPTRTLLGEVLEPRLPATALGRWRSTSRTPR